MDDLIDRELRRALAVTPSPEFIARVRTTIAEAPRPSVFAGGWKPAAMACVVALMMGVGFSRHAAQFKLSPAEVAPVRAGLKASTTSVSPSTNASPSTNVSSTNVSPARASEARSDVVPTFSPQPRSGEPTEALAKAGRLAAVADVEPPLPEVLVAPKDTAALQHVVRNAHAYLVTFDEAPVASAWVMNDLTISPITIEPLESAPAYNN